MISKLPKAKETPDCNHQCDTFYVDEYDVKVVMDDDEEPFEIDIVIHHEICSCCNVTLDSWDEETAPRENDEGDDNKVPPY